MESPSLTSAGPPRATPQSLGLGLATARPLGDDSVLGGRRRADGLTAPELGDLTDGASRGAYHRRAHAFCGDLGRGIRRADMAGGLEAAWRRWAAVAGSSDRGHAAGSSGSAVAAASGAASVRVWEVMSRERGATSGVSGARGR